MRRTVAGAGRTVFFSGLTVAVSLVGIVVYQAPFLRSLGLAATAVVAVDMLAAVTLLPALLARYGWRISPARVSRRFWWRGVAVAGTSRRIGGGAPRSLRERRPSEVRRVRRVRRVSQARWFRRVRRVRQARQARRVRWFRRVRQVRWVPRVPLFRLPAPPVTEGRSFARIAAAAVRRPRLCPCGHRHGTADAGGPGDGAGIHHRRRARTAPDVRGAPGLRPVPGALPRLQRRRSAGGARAGRGLASRVPGAPGRASRRGLGVAADVSGRQRGAAADAVRDLRRRGRRRPGRPRSGASTAARWSPGPRPTSSTTARCWPTGCRTRSAPSCWRCSCCCSCSPARS